MGLTPTSVSPLVDVRGAWAALSKWLPYRTSDTQWWFNTTGPHLVSILSEAGYTLSRQYEILLFHYQVVVPYLGLQPTSPTPPWNSFMTDDFSPIEYSWKWGLRGDDPPDIRYGMEALGQLTRTAIDPLNQMATCELLHRMAPTMPDADLTLFYQLRDSFFGPGGTTVTTPNNAYHGHATWSIAGNNNNTTTTRDQVQSSLFLAFEMLRDSMSVKVYFIPVARPDFPVADQISAAIRTAGFGHDSGAVAVMQDFLAHDPDGQSLEPFMLGIDCVSPSKSRLKIYMRSSRTSFSFVRQVMTLGGRRNVPHLDKVSSQFNQLWNSTIGLADDFPADEELPRRTHSTSGTCFYFDVAPKSPAPDVKAYIPVRHYGASDKQVVKGLERFLASQGRSRYARAYAGIVDRLATPEGSGVATGVQTYISCAYQGEGVSMASYLSPQLYHPARWNFRR